jgi:hypothetical protein
MLYLHTPNTPSWRGSQLKHRDNFTLPSKKGSNIISTLTRYTEIHQIYEGVSKSSRTGCLERELQMIQLSATRWSCIAILWVSLVIFAAITHCVASQRVLVLISLSTQSGNFWIHPRIDCHEKKIVDLPVSLRVARPGVQRFSKIRKQNQIVWTAIHDDPSGRIVRNVDFISPPYAVGAKREVYNTKSIGYH